MKHFIASLTLLLILAGGCSLFNQAGTLEVLEKTVSVQINETAEIHVTAEKRPGRAEGITILECDECVNAEVTSENLITVEGLSYGEGTVTIQSDSGVSKEVLVRVYDPMALMFKGLSVRFTDQFTWIWDDSGSGADDNGSFWMPAAPEGYYPLGSCGVSGWGDPSGTKAAVVVKDIDGTGVLSPPEDYVKIWDDSGSGADDNCSVWKPVPPEGYVALGVVAQLGYTKPDTDLIRCVKSEYTATGKVGSWVWDDSGSGGSYDFSAFRVEAPDAPNSPGYAYLVPETIIGVNSYTKPSSHEVCNVLNIKLPLVTDLNDSAYAPVLESYDEPEKYTDTYLAKVVAVPFTLVVDDSYSLHEKVTEFPIYRIRREEYYTNQYFYNNRYGSTPITHTVTDTVGISETESETYSVNVGLKITTESGCELIGGTVTVELSFEFGYETTSSYTVFQENEVSQEVEIAPNTAGCLWQKTTRFTLMRNKNSWEDVAGSNKVITIDSFVKGEYPN